MFTDGERLDQGSVLPWDGFLDLVNIGFLHAPVLPPAAVGTAAAYQNVLADIATAMGALVAVAAAHDVVHDHMVADLNTAASLTHLGHDTNVLVARDQRIAGVGVFAPEDVDITAADTGSHHFDLDLARLRFRNGYLADLIVERFRHDTRFHRFFPPISGTAILSPAGAGRGTGQKHVVRQSLYYILR